MTPLVFKNSRKLIKLSQSALADRLGLDRKTIYRIETSDEPVPVYFELALRWVAQYEHNTSLPYEYQDELL